MQLFVMWGCFLLNLAWSTRKLNWFCETTLMLQCLQPSFPTAL